MHLLWKYPSKQREAFDEKSLKNCVFHVFSKGFHPNTFRDIIIKGFDWTITKWRTQSHSCSWAIQPKSPLNIQCNNFEHTKNKVQYIYNVSRSYKLIRHWGRARRAVISQTTFSYVLTFSLLKIAVFRFELHLFVPRVKLEVSVRFRIWMLITDRWLETLQRANRGVETIRFAIFFTKNTGRNTTFSSSLFKYRGRNYTNFPETWKRRVEVAEHM